jgi:PAS domain S-box-containing protein
MTECSPDAIIVYKEGKILYTNLSGQRLFSAERKEDLMGKDILDLFNPGERESLRLKISQAIIGARLVLDKVRMLRLDGTDVLVQVSFGKIVWDKEPALLAIIRVATD